MRERVLFIVAYLVGFLALITCADATGPAVLPRCSEPGTAAVYFTVPNDARTFKLDINVAVCSETAPPGIPPMFVEDGAVQLRLVVPVSDILPGIR